MQVKTLVFMKIFNATEVDKLSELNMFMKNSTKVQIKFNVIIVY